jgi:hypothetical protein
MAFIENTLEGGTEGANVTTANSGGVSGTAFATVSTPASQSQYRAVAAYSGAFGMLVNSLSASAPIVDLDDASAASSVALRFYLRMDSYPSVTNVQFPVNFRSLSGPISRTDFDDTGAIRIGNLAYSTDKLAIGTWYRIECQGTGFGAGAGAGTLSMQVYVGDNTGTPYISQTATGQTLGSAVQRIRYGKNSPTPTTADFTYAMDNFAQNIGTSTPIGPMPPGDAGPDQSNIAGGATVTLTATGQGLWSQVSGPAVSLNGAGYSRTFTAPSLVAGATLVFDYGGDTCTVTVQPASIGTLVTNNAEGGTEALAVTTGNSGGLSGTPFTLVSQGSAGVITFVGAAAYRGNFGYWFNQPSNSLASLFDINADTPSDAWTCRFYIYLNTLPSTDHIQFPIMIRGASGVLGRTEMNTSGQLRVVNGTTGSYSSASLTTGVWYRVEYYGTGAGTSNTNARVDVYVGDNTGTPFLTASQNGQTTGEQVTLIRYGKASSTPTSTMSFYIDDIGQSIGSSVPLGPSPTGSAGPDQTVEPWSIVTLTATDTGSWSQVSGPAVTLSGSGLTRTFKAPGVLNNTALVFAYGGDTCTVTVLAATERAVMGGVEVPLEIRDATL